MTEIVNVILSKCGTCQYAQKFDTKQSADCYGHPPSIHILGATKDVLGRAALQIETFVPRVHKDRPACALYRIKVDFATVGNG